MSRPAIFFDRDNTLILNDAYLGDPDGVKLIPGAANAIARARRLGFAIITASNQSGVARGFYPAESVEAVNARMDELLIRENPQAIIDRHEYCPFHPDGSVEEYKQDSDLRKPRPGMILRAAEAMDIDLEESWLIGDAPRDIEAGHAAGCKTILVNDPTIPPSQASNDASRVEADETVGSLEEALEVIEEALSAEPTIAATSRALADLEVSRQRLRIGESFSPTPGEPLVGGISQPHKILRPGRSGAPAFDFAKLESATAEILELVRKRDAQSKEFSISKLVAGITQVLAMGVAVGAWFYKSGNDLVVPLLVAVFIQGFTVALLLMARDQK